MTKVIKRAEEIIVSIKKWIQKYSGKKSRKIAAIGLICLLIILIFFAIILPLIL